MGWGCRSTNKVDPRVKWVPCTTQGRVQYPAFEKKKKTEKEKKTPQDAGEVDRRFIKIKFLALSLM